MKKKIIKFLIDKAKRSKLVQSIFEQPINLNSFQTKGSFTDSNGNKHILYDGFGSKIRPGWERVFQTDAKKFNKTPQVITSIMQNGKIAVDRIEPIINLYSSGIKGSKLLEIGCSTGGSTFAFAEKGALEVVGSEFSDYKIESLNSKTIEDNDLQELNENLTEIRNLVKDKFNITSSNVSFVDDDICNSKLKHNSFDLICSWDVLEHLHDPLLALKNTSNLLKDTGIAIHEYNPFFSLIGGHSPCTMDFPWGHVLLNNDDFKKFNEVIQPEKLDTAMSFYLNGLNRMTIQDLKNYSSEANLEIVSLITFPKEQDLRMMNANIMKIAINNYPTLEINDLISTKIIVVFKKLIKKQY